MAAYPKIVKILVSFLNGFYASVNRHYLRFRYDATTIAEKFRKEGAKIGKNCYFQIRSLGPEPYLIDIGDDVSIAAGVVLITHDGASVIFRDELPYLRYFGKIIIENNCFIGANTIITAGVRIGHHSIIGPNATVIADVKPGSIMVGNPAIRVSTVEKYKEKCLQEWARQGLTKFEPLFQGKSKYAVQEIMMSKSFRRMLKEHFQSNDYFKRDL
jgi:acetyltransferase-like isoleucine patch superfamily enzyme